MIVQFLKACQNKKIKRFSQACIVSLMVWVVAFPTQLLSAPVYKGSSQGVKIKTLVIDPGHGGKDPGAIGLGGHREAHLALAISLKFGSLIEAYFPEIKVIYTRKKDEFISLKDRADMANKAKADLFFCIHLNAATNREAHGSSTYTLGLHKSSENLEVAKRENSVIELEEGGLSNYDFDPNSPEGHIIMSMKQHAFLDQSLKIADHIEKQQVGLAQRKSRGVKQAGFWVLYRTAMPAILTEIGFISNPNEEQFMASESGQRKIAASLFYAFLNYKNDIENKNDAFDLSAYLKGEKIKAQPSVPKEQEQKKAAEAMLDTIVKKVDTTPIIVVKKDTVINEKPQITAEKSDTEAIPVSAEITTYQPKESEPSEEPQKTAEKPVLEEQVLITYFIQITASSSPPKNGTEIQGKFGKIYTDVVPNSNLTRYLLGNVKTVAEARKKLEQVRTSGFPDAFIVVYENGIRITEKQRYMQLLE